MEDILDLVRKVTKEERERDYGHPAINFARIAAFWNIYLAAKLKDSITLSDIAWMMVLLKIAREMESANRDNRVDAIGYVTCIERIQDMIGNSDSFSIQDLMNIISGMESNSGT
ncbi:MAG: hypothetical protein CUN55_00475 [Phototrophicales bacterium]|nr:MAG: hypothetical protein CUN55_00475 [Phototrophicales bacterium]